MKINRFLSKIGLRLVRHYGYKKGKIRAVGFSLKFNRKNEHILPKEYFRFLAEEELRRLNGEPNGEPIGILRNNAAKKEDMKDE